jgi:hypothetical protein
MPSDHPPVPLLAPLSPLFLLPFFSSYYSKKKIKKQKVRKIYV